MEKTTLIESDVIYITIENAETDYGPFFKATAAVADGNLTTDGYARDDRRAVAYALRHLADLLIEASTGEIND